MDWQQKKPGETIHIGATTDASWRLYWQFQLDF
jgi:hypothetical protein